jgi:transketolase
MGRPRGQERQGRRTAAPHGGELPDQSEVQATFDAWLESCTKVATRKASELALEVLTAHVPEMVGGSADLTGSNLTTKATTPFGPQDYSGRYVYYGIREFGMAAAMNGMALHGGIIPYGGTFLCFRIIAAMPFVCRLCRRPRWSMC